jgi:hypothetical protein
LDKKFSSISRENMENNEDPDEELERLCKITLNFPKEKVEQNFGSGRF